MRPRSATPLNPHSLSDGTGRSPASTARRTRSMSIIDPRRRRLIALAAGRIRSGATPKKPQSGRWVDPINAHLLAALRVKRTRSPS